MSAPPLFYVPECNLEQEGIRLDGAQANHIVGSRRLRDGNLVLLTNGKGVQLTAKITAVGPRQKWVELAVEAAEMVAKPATTIILASAVAKGDRQATLVDMACQLGVSEIWPVQFEHSVSRASESQTARWQRIAIEACKQSRRVWFPVVKSLISLEQVLAHKQESNLWLAHQYGDKQNTSMQIDPVFPQILIVGPEAGLTEQELVRCKNAEVQSISLGRHILRIETACSAIIAAINQLA